MRPLNPPTWIRYVVPAVTAVCVREAWLVTAKRLPVSTTCTEISSESTAPPFARLSRTVSCRLIVGLWLGSDSAQQAGLAHTTFGFDSPEASSTRFGTNAGCRWSAGSCG